MRFSPFGERHEIARTQLEDGAAFDRDPNVTFEHVKRFVAGKLIIEFTDGMSPQACVQLAFAPRSRP